MVVSDTMKQEQHGCCGHGMRHVVVVVAAVAAVMMAGGGGDDDGGGGGIGISAWWAVSQ